MEEQRTIEKEFFLKGKGLQTGKPVEAFFYPAGDGEGISFVRKDLKKKPPIRLVDPGVLTFSADRRSIVRRDAENYVETVEHLLAALWGAGVSNIKIELDSSEPPAMDGSARDFLEALLKAGIKKQNSAKNFIEIKEPLWVEEKDSFLGIFPSDIYKISYIFEHPYAACGRQSFSEVLTRDIFSEKIAPARTLWFVPPGPGSIEEKAEAVKKQGYGRGADPENTLVIDENKIVNTPRFSDEPVRHGVLDLVGDLYLLNRPVKGRIIAIRSGHALNLELVKKINKRYTCR